jgi:catechol 2,3-dioxygenase-like lactoylglutathione lyase family enzyme
MILDHLVLIVDNLEAASRLFSRLGFNVLPGGVHPGWGTHNALIGLPDGCYLELLAAVDESQAARYRQLKKVGALRLATSGKPPIHSRFIENLACGSGLADFALLSKDLDEEIGAARRKGLEFVGPFEGGRRRPDGQAIAWRTAIPGGEGLPFLMEDITPRALRLPPQDTWAHPNGATSVASVAISCLDLKASAGQYRRLLGRPAEEGNPDPETHAATVCFRLRESELVLHQARIVATRRNGTALQSIRLRTSQSARLLSLAYLPHQGYVLR